MTFYAQIKYSGVYFNHEFNNIEKKKYKFKKLTTVENTIGYSVNSDSWIVRVSET